MKEIKKIMGVILISAKGNQNEKFLIDKIFKSGLYFFCANNAKDFSQDELNSLLFQIIL